MTEIAHNPETSAAVTPVALLKRSWKLLVLLGAVGALAGASAAMVLKPKWIAKVTVQVGQLSAVSANGITSRSIENQLTVAERYNAPALRIEVLHAMGYPNQTINRDAKLYFDTLRAGTGRSPDTVNLQVSGYSRQGAQNAMSASFKVLAAIHSLQFDPTISRLKDTLEDINSDIATAQQQYDKSLDSLKATTSRGSSSAQDVLVTNLASTLNSRIVELKSQAALIQEALEPARTYPTRMLGEAYAPEEPATPGPILLTIAGMAIGLVIGALIAFVRRVPRG